MYTIYINRPYYILAQRSFTISPRHALYERVIAFFYPPCIETQHDSHCVFVKVQSNFSISAFFSFLSCTHSPPVYFKSFSIKAYKRSNAGKEFEKWFKIFVNFIGGIWKNEKKFPYKLQLLSRNCISIVIVYRQTLLRYQQSASIFSLRNAYLTTYACMRESRVLLLVVGIFF